MPSCFSVPLLKNLSEQELAKLADVMEEVITHDYSA